VTLIWAALASALLQTATPSDSLSRRVESAPHGVASFIKRRANCNHFLGEEPYDRDRARELERTIVELRCSRIDDEERNLARTYKKQQVIIQLLKDTEKIIGW
jgi:hypothetical protein